jgi:hypothetical protein
MVDAIGIKLIVLRDLGPALVGAMGKQCRIAHVTFEPSKTT